MQFQETENIELKAILNDSFEREVVAFLNTDGGTIYIGINNEGQIVGVKNIDEVMKTISNVCIDKILPLPTEFIESKAIYENGKMIIVVNIQKGNSLFYIKRYGRSSLGCYIRVGTTVRAMTEAQIEKKFIKSLEISEKTIFEKRNYRQNLSFTILKTLLLSKGQHINDESFNETYILLNENNEFNYYAGLLDDNADVSIKVATFKGKDKTLFLKRQEFGFQCLLIAIKNVISYIDSINDTYIDTSIRPRIEKRKFSQEAFIEAWTNAVVHNDWKQGVPPAIYIYDDRLEIVSIGGLPKGQTIESFFKGRSVPINEPMIRLFMKLDLMEQNGHGIPIIIKEYGKDVFEIEDNCISVTIPFNNIKDADAINDSLNDESDSLNDEFDSLNDESDSLNGESDSLNDESDSLNDESDSLNDESDSLNSESDSLNDEFDSLNGESDSLNDESDSLNSEFDSLNDEFDSLNSESDSLNGESDSLNGESDSLNSESDSLNYYERIILKLIFQNPKIMRKEIADASGISIANIDRIIKRLKENGIIKRIGSKKNGYWKLNVHK